MKYISMNDLKFSFDDQGNTTQISVSYNTFNEGERFNAQVILTNDYVQSANENLTLDNMSKTQCDNLARRRLREWLNVDEPTDDTTNTSSDSTSQETTQ